LFSRQKMDMNSFPVSVMGCNQIWLNDIRNNAFWWG
jgi:hypothetical protein